MDCGYWPLFRFDPRRANSGENPLMLDSAAPKIDLAKYTANETRFRVVEQMDPARFKMLQHHAQDWVTQALQRVRATGQDGVPGGEVVTGTA